MEAYILNKNFEIVSLLDSYTSFIWTDRYYGAGDFEVYIPASVENINRFKIGYYLWNRDSEHMMIIEDRKITSDIETGNNLTVTGRSLESLLDRRIIWNQTVIKESSDQSFQNGIKKILNQNVISPSLEKRRIDNFKFSASTDPAITTLTMDGQYRGENVYTVIKDICEDNNIGFKVTLNSNNEFVFKLYAGVDRSYQQETNPFVVFSPSFENIINSEYIESTAEYKNVALVGGEGEGKDKKVAESGKTSSTNLDRREMYVTANISTNSDEQISAAEYTRQLKQAGKEELKKNKITKTIEGEVETSKIFVYQQDYFLGDILEVENEYGIKSPTRVVEFIRKQDDDGYKAYPSFEVVVED